MELCYLDESGTHQIPGNTSHYVLAGLSMPDNVWKRHDADIEQLRRAFGLERAEIHTAWILRPYAEQQSIPQFESLNPQERRAEVERLRREELSRLKRSGSARYGQLKKDYKRNAAYVHLTLSERRRLIRRVAQLIGSWGQARLFAECIDKLHFNPRITGSNVEEQAFEQVVSRFEQSLRNRRGGHGLLIHDNNHTVARRHTELMKSFLRSGTLWTDVEHVIETPMFVDSQLTSMVQLADVAAYALRRYLENGEEELFDLVFQRADRAAGFTVGVRHFTGQGCQCKICVSHG